MTFANRVPGNATLELAYSASRLLLLCSSVSTCLWAQPGTQPCDVPIHPETVVATVEGEEILYRDVQVGDDQLRVLHKRQVIEGGSRAESLLSMADLKVAAERGRLTSRIQELIRGHWTERFGILVDDEEVKDEIQRRMQAGGFTEVDVETGAEETLRSYRAVISALEDVLNQRMTSDKAYDAYLKERPGWTPAMWDDFVLYYDRLDQLDRLRRVADNLQAKGSGAIQVEPMIRADLLEQERGRRILEVIALSDPELGNVLQRLDAADPGEAQQIHREYDEYFQMQIQLWWTETYRTSEVKVHQCWTEAWP